VLAALALAWLVSRASVPRVPFRAVLGVIAAYWPVALVIQLALETWAPAALSPWSAAVLVGVGLGLVAQRLRGLGVVRLWPAMLCGALALFAFTAVTERAYISARTWYAVGDRNESGESIAQPGERLLFGQADRIDAALAALAPRDAGHPNVYFVGFAGYAEERVFAEEISFAANVVGKRYDSSGRAVLLINDRRNLESWPLATVTGLRRALAGVAKQMDLTQDVLFLVLSSHGSRDPELAVSNGSLPLEQLDGEALKAALDDSAIKWRVIVISACHAGAFIAPLRDDRSILITAAAAERTSFGCSDDRDLTWFGEALFRDALPAAPNLEAAFAKARKLIAERETQQDVEVSDPQGYFGVEIKQHWDAIERAPRAMETNQ